MLVAAFAAAEAPAGREAPLPAAEEFLKDARERHRRFEAALNDYTYDVEVTDEELDKTGAVRSRKTRRYETFFVKGHRVRRLVSEDGKPLAAERQARVDKEVEKDVADILSGKEDRRRAGVSELLERYDFRSVSREPLEGRPAIVMEFVPKAGKQDLAHDNVLRRLAGRVWVDEEERVVVRSEVRNVGGIKVALGLAASVRDLEVTTDFVKVDEAIWLPRRIQTRVAGRLMLFKGVNRRTTATFSGYRRFQVDVTETPRP